MRRRIMTVEPRIKLALDAVAGDIALYDSKLDRIIIADKDYFPCRFSYNYIPIGVVVIPGNHHVYNTGEVMIMSLKFMNCTTPDTGSTSRTYIIFGSNLNLDGLDIRNKTPRVGLYSDTNPTISNSLINWTIAGNVPVDTSGDGINNPYDPKTKWVNPSNLTTILCPSPYDISEDKNSTFFLEYLSENKDYNVLTAFTGKENTKIFVDNAIAQSNWKTDSTISNTAGDGYYPLVCCAWRYHTDGTKQGDWYIAGSGEYAYVVVRLYCINSTVNKLATYYGTYADIPTHIANTHTSTPNGDDTIRALFVPIGHEGNNTPTDTQEGGPAFTRISDTNSIPKSIRDNLVLWYDPKRQGCTNENMQESPILKDLSGNGYDATCYNFGSTDVDLTGWIIKRNGVVENTLTRTAHKVTVTNIANNLAFIWSNVNSTVSNVIVKVSGLQDGQSVSFGTDQRKDGAYVVSKDGIYSFDYTQYCDNPIGTPINRCIWSDTISGDCNFTIEFLGEWGQSSTYPTDFTNSTWRSYPTHSTLTENTATKISGTPVYLGKNCWLKFFRESNSMPEMYVKVTKNATTNLMYRYVINGETLEREMLLQNGIYKLPESKVNPNTTDTHNPWGGFYILNSKEGDSATIELLPNPSGIGGYYAVDFNDWTLYGSSNFDTTLTSNKITAIANSGDQSTASTIAYFNSSTTTCPSYKVNIRSNNNDILIRFYYCNENNIRSYIDLTVNQIHEIPASRYKEGNIWYGFTWVQNYNEGDWITIEQLPMYYGGLVFDGTDDYVKAENVPLLTDFTVIAKREIFNKDGNGVIINKGDSTFGANNTITLEGMERLQPTFPVVYSFGAGTHIDISDNDIIYMTKDSYNGISINTGSTSDNSPNIYLGTFRSGDSRYLKGVIHSIMLFDRTLTEQEINWVKDNLCQ